MSEPLAPGEELVQVRAGAWRMLLPMRFVERVFGAALPAVRPDAPPVVAIGAALVPVLFADALLGAPEVGIDAEDQMVLLRDGARRALLWVDAVEEVVGYAPVPAPPDGAERSIVAAFSGAARPLAVLDVPRLLELAA